MSEKPSDTYLTIENSTEATFKDKGSKFIAFASSVKNIDEIKATILSLKSEHYKARHHCYAWRLGADHKNCRANDDGEPSNSAGNPILGQIKSFELTDILIVVVRYFGGTLLGVGGLINAYKTVSREALLEAKIIQKEVRKIIVTEFEYQLMSHIIHIIKDRNIEIIGTEYSSNCKIFISVKLSDTEYILQTLNNTFGVLAYDQKVN
ncbi:MAG: YigZ family protein [Bacteroidales bacterium]